MFLKKFQGNRDFDQKDDRRKFFLARRLANFIAFLHLITRYISDSPTAFSGNSVQHVALPDQ